VSLSRLVPIALALCVVALAATTLRPRPRPDAVSSGTRGAPEPDPPEVAIGERLFLETRFARFFFENAAASVNARLTRGDPVLERTLTPTGSLPGTFAAGAMNCRACHLVDEHARAGGGSRAYADFARRSPVPAREDGLLATPRNSPAMVNATLAREDLLLHLDGEFLGTEDLVRETLLGRNFGWLPGERADATRHLARVIREDDGTDSLALRFGGAYRRVLAASPSVPAAFRLPADYALDVRRASDEQILDAVTRLISAYVKSLVFHQDEKGEYDGSPYDAFLSRNRLPRQPGAGESDSAYAARLLRQLETLSRPRFVGPGDGTLRLHRQPFVFGQLELSGLGVFLRRPDGASAAGGTGNCVACHPPPHFTDFGFHNTGAAQSEYDAIHGQGAFARLHVPGLDERNARPSVWLAPTSAHPRAQGRLRSAPSREHPERADLGLWNVLGNPAHPRPQAAIRRALRERAGETPRELLARSIGRYKTPGLRDLGHSDPYFHTGRAATIEEALALYLEFSNRARDGSMRNADPELRGVTVGAADLTALAAFLRSLNEDYE
jgi:cytochrome c peroxidase